MPVLLAPREQGHRLARVAAGDVIRRRRECEACTRRFTTYERVEDVLPTVVKKDGAREPFDRQKLLRGVRARLQQAAGGDRAHRALIDELERELRRARRKEVPQRGARRAGDAPPARARRGGLRPLRERVPHRSATSTSSDRSSTSWRGPASTASAMTPRDERSTIHGRSASDARFRPEDDKWMRVALDEARRVALAEPARRRGRRARAASRRRGHHERAGEEHAEVVALQQGGRAGARAARST